MKTQNYKVIAIIGCNQIIALELTSNCSVSSDWRKTGLFMSGEQTEIPSSLMKTIYFCF